ncbi:hypothetical protein A2U01_0096513, partial [Trifolium medium]|nr:hypothetical protein [Trifolium medium]
MEQCQALEEHDIVSDGDENESSVRGSASKWNSWMKKCPEQVKNDIVFGGDDNGGAASCCGLLKYSIK